MTFVQFLRSTNSTKIFIAYKRKDSKMKFNDICVLNDSKFDDDVTWKENIIKKKKYFKNFTNQFAEFFIFKFSELTKEARLKFERIQRMQIKNELLKRGKGISFWNVVQSRDRTFLRFYQERLSSFESYVVHENSHDVSRSLTNSRVSAFQSVDWDNRRNDKKSNQKRRAWILLWVLSKFLISCQEEEKKNIVWSMSL
jgi:hypothetical protein